MADDANRAGDLELPQLRQINRLATSARMVASLAHELIREIQTLVEQTAGVSLEPEVKLIGAFDDARR